MSDETSPKDGWGCSPLAELIGAGLIVDGDWVESKDQDPNGNVRLIQLADIGDGNFRNRSDRWLNKQTAERIGCTYLKAGDLLVSRLADPLGRCCVFPGFEYESVTAVDVCVIRPTSVGVEPKWLKNAINSDHFRRSIDVVSSGTTRKRVSRRNLGKLELPVPPLAEQRRIVAKVEALQERTRAARTALESVEPLLEQFRRSLLAAAFRGDLTADWREQNPDVEPASELLARIRQQRRQQWEADQLAKYEAKGKKPPKGWREKYKVETELELSDMPDLPTSWTYARADEVVAPDTIITYGIVLPGPEVEGGVPYIRGKDIEDGRILREQLLRTAEEIHEKHRRSEVEGGDVLLCIIRHLKVAVVPDEFPVANLTQGTVRIRPADGVERWFLARHLEGPFAQHWMKRQYFGMAMPRINVEDARRLPIPLAPLAEQREIVDRLDSALTHLEHVATAVHSITSEVDIAAQSILSNAFSGELVPQDPSDEPASVLLERIRAEREAAKPAKKRGGRKSAAKSGSSKLGETTASEPPTGRLKTGQTRRWVLAIVGTLGTVSRTMVSEVLLKIAEPNPESIETAIQYLARPSIEKLIYVGESSVAIGPKAGLDAESVSEAERELIDAAVDELRKELDGQEAAENAGGPHEPKVEGNRSESDAVRVVSGAAAADG